MAYLGLPYAWGGGGSHGPGPGQAPDLGVIGFDCSGLTQYAYRQAGIRIQRNSRAQYASLPKVSSDDLQPGDLVFWATDPADPGTIHHVAIYLGGEQDRGGARERRRRQGVDHAVAGLRGRGAPQRLTPACRSRAPGTERGRKGVGQPRGELPDAESRLAVPALRGQGLCTRSRNTLE